MTQRLVGRSTALVVAVLLLTATIVLLMTERRPDPSGVQQAVLTKAEPQASSGPSATGATPGDEPRDDATRPSRPDTDQPRAQRTERPRAGVEAPRRQSAAPPATSAPSPASTPSQRPKSPEPSPTTGRNGNPVGDLLAFLLGRR